MNLLVWFLLVTGFYQMRNHVTGDVGNGVTFDDLTGRR